jgi:putative DNA primase/helicase
MSEPEVDPIEEMKTKTAKEWESRKPPIELLKKLANPMKPKLKLVEDELIDEALKGAKQKREEGPKAEQKKEEGPKAKAEEPKQEAPKQEAFEIIRTVKLYAKTSPKFFSSVENTLVCLKDSPAGIYQRGGKLVRLINEAGKGVMGERVDVTKLAEVTDKALEIKMMKHIKWTKDSVVKSKDGGERIVEQPTSPIGSGIASYALEMRGEWPFPTIEGVINAPTLRSDGSLLSKVGYDQQTGLLLINSPNVHIPRLTPEDAERAIVLLRQLYEETEFSTDGSRGVVLSLILSTVLCGAIRNTPLHIVKAPVGGSGKTYAVQIAHVLATGEKAVPIGRTINKEEFEKRLSAAFVEGRQMIFLDNINGPLEHEMINQAVTGDEVLIRRFGVIENIRVATRQVIVANGNGISIGGDLDRRTLMAEIDTRLEKPHFKKYRADPIDMIHADRAKYIAAALTIPLAYLAAGCPQVTDKPVADFADWTRFVRDPLVWLGEKDPVITMDRAIMTHAGKQYARSMRLAMKALIGVGKSYAKSCQYIIDEITNPHRHVQGAKEVLRLDASKADAWREALMAVAGVGQIPQAKRLGQWFAVTKDIIEDGLVIRGELSAHAGSHVWWVEEC